jgi:hypothetical protein
MTDIKVFKLISGEEIIAEMFSWKDGLYELKSPATIIMQQTEKGIGMALMAYMPYADGNINLYKQCIASEGVPSDKMINEYNRLFGSGIEIAPASALAGLQMP